MNWQTSRSGGDKAQKAFRALCSVTVAMTLFSCSRQSSAPPELPQTGQDQQLTTQALYNTSADSAKDASLSLTFPGLNRQIAELVVEVYPADSSPDGFGLRQGAFATPVVVKRQSIDLIPSTTLARVPELVIPKLLRGYHNVVIKGIDRDGIQIYEGNFKLLSKSGTAGPGFGYHPGEPEKLVASPIRLERSLTSLEVTATGDISGGALVVRSGGLFAGLDAATQKGGLSGLPTQKLGRVLIERLNAKGEVAAQGLVELPLLPGGNQATVALGPVRDQPLDVMVTAPKTPQKPAEKTRLELSFLSGAAAAIPSELHIDWGDGEVEKVSGLANQMTPTHTYAYAGLYEVTLWTRSVGGTWATDTAAIQVGTGEAQSPQQSLLNLELLNVPTEVTALDAVFTPEGATTADGRAATVPEQRLRLTKGTNGWEGATTIRRDQPYKLWLYATAQGREGRERSLATQLNISESQQTLSVQYNRVFGCQINGQFLSAQAMVAQGCGPGPGPGPDDNSPECILFGACQESLDPLKFKPRSRPQPRRWNSAGWPQPWSHPCSWPELRGACSWGGWGGGSGNSSGFSGRYMGGAWGDPHLTTLDGGRFTSLELGEFIYLVPTEDPEDGVQLQVRQTRLPGLPDWASFNTAAALRAGGHTFQVELPKDRFITQRNQLLIDGQPTDLAPGFYAMGPATILNVAADNAITVTHMPTGATAPIKVYIGTASENNLTREDPTTPVVALKINAEFPSAAPYRGVLGTPDGVYENDTTLPDGSRARGLADFMEAWRVTDRRDSLFTYVEGQGPETYNIEQKAKMPTTEQLTADGFIARAENLLANTCKADLSKIDPSFIEAVAIDMAAGRSERNLLESGICGDEHVDLLEEEDTDFIGFEFSGQLTVKGLGIPAPGAKVTVTARELGNKVLCESVAAEEGRYSCGISDYAREYPETLTLDYRITGLGEPVTFTQTVSKPGDTPLELAKNFEIEPQVILHLRGTVKDMQGQPVSALLETAQPMINQTSIQDGQYELYLPLPNDLTSGLIKFRAVTSKQAAEVTEGFDIPADSRGVVELTQNLTVAFANYNAYVTSPEQRNRQMIFSGEVLNSLIKEATGKDDGVSGVPVKITSPGIQGGFCATETSATGQYSCAAFLVDDQPFTAQISIDNGAETKTVTLGTEAIPAVGMTLTHKQDFTYAPTTLLLEGVVRTSAGEALEGTDVTVSVSGLSERPLVASGKSMSDGGYKVYLTLPRSGQALSEKASVTARLQTGTGSAEQTKEFSFTAAPRSLTRLQQDFTLNAKLLTLTGRVTHREIEGLAVPGAQVIISEAGQGEVCRTTTNEDGLYQCPLFIGDEPLSFTYKVTNFGGDQRAGVTFDPSTIAVGTRGVVTQNLTVKPSVIKVQGQVIDSQGTAAAGAKVRIPWSRPVELVTDLQGRYAAYLTLTQPPYSGSLTLNGEYVTPNDSLRGQTQLTYDVPEGTVQTINQNIILDGTITDSAKSAKVTFQGEVRNSLLPGQSVQGATIEIWGAGESEGLGKICSTVSKSISPTVHYSCTATFLTSRNLEVEYRAIMDGQPLGEPVRAQWTVLQDTAFGSTVSQDLVYAPPTHVIRGRVTDQLGRPVAGAQVGDASLSQWTVSDIDGYYTLPIVSSKAVEAQLVAKLDAVTSATRPLTLSPVQGLDEVAGINLELPITGRQLIFEGKVVNTLVPAGLAVRGLPIAIAIANGGQSLCQTTTDANGLYRCAVTWNQGSDLELTYTVAGETSAQTITSLPSPGGQRVYSQSFNVAPPTLHLTGVVKDINGNAFTFPGLALNVGNSFYESTVGQENGTYSWYVALPKPVQEATSELKVNHASGAKASYSFPVTVGQGQMVSVQHDFRAEIPENLGTTVKLSGVLKDENGTIIPNATVQLGGDLQGQFRTDANGSYGGFFNLPTSQSYAEVTYTVTYTSRQIVHEQTKGIALHSGQLNLINQEVVVPATGELKLSPVTTSGQADKPLTFKADVSTFTSKPILSWGASAGELTATDDGLTAAYIPPASLQDQSYVVSVRSKEQVKEATVTVPASRPTISRTPWNRAYEQTKLIVFAGVPVPLEGTGLDDTQARWTATGGTFEKAEGNKVNWTPPSATGEATITYGHAKSPDVKTSLTVNVVPAALTLDRIGATGYVGQEHTFAIQNVPPYLCSQVKVSAGTVNGCYIKIKPEAAGVQTIQVSLPGTSVPAQSIRVEALPPELRLPNSFYGMPGSQVTIEADTRGFATPPELFWKVTGATYAKDGSKITLTLPESGTVSVSVSGAGQTRSTTVYVIKPEISTYHLKDDAQKIILLPGKTLSVYGDGIPDESGRWKATGGTFTDDAGRVATFTPPTEPGQYTLTYFHKDSEAVAQTIEFEVGVPEFSLAYEKTGFVGDTIGIRVTGLSTHNCSQLKASGGVYNYYGGCYFYKSLDSVGEHQFTLQFPGLAQTTQSGTVTATARPEAVRLGLSYDNPGLYGRRDYANLGDTRRLQVYLDNFATVPQVEWSVDGGAITPSADGLTAVFTAPEQLEGQTTQATYTVTASANGVKGSYPITVFKQPPAITQPSTYSVDSRPALWAGVPVKLYSDWVMNTKGTWSSSSGTVTNIDKAAAVPSYRTETTFTPPSTPGPVQVTFAHDTILDLSATVNFEVVVPQPKLQTEALTIAPGERKYWRVEGIPSYMCQAMEYKLDGLTKRFGASNSWGSNYCDIYIDGITAVGQHELEITIKDVPGTVIKGQLNVTSEVFQLQLAKEQKVHAGTSIRIDVIDENGQPFKGDLVWKAERGSFNYNYGTGYADFYPGDATGPIRITTYLRSNPSNVQTITVESIIDPITVVAPQKVLPGQRVLLEAKRPDGTRYPLQLVWNSTAGEIDGNYWNATTYFTAPTEPGQVRIVVQPYGKAEPVTSVDIEVVPPPKPPVLTLGQNLQSPLNILYGQRIPIRATDENGQAYQEELTWKVLPDYSGYIEADSSVQQPVNPDTLGNSISFTPNPWYGNEFTVIACLKNHASICKELPLNINVNQLPPIELLWKGEKIEDLHSGIGIISRTEAEKAEDSSARQQYYLPNVLIGEEIKIVKPQIVTDIPLNVSVTASYQKRPTLSEPYGEPLEILNVSVDKMSDMVTLPKVGLGYILVDYVTDPNVVNGSGRDLMFVTPRIEPFDYNHVGPGNPLEPSEPIVQPSASNSHASTVAPNPGPFHDGPVMTLVAGERWTVKAVMPKYASQTGQWSVGNGLTISESSSDNLTFSVTAPDTLSEVCYSVAEHKECLSVIIFAEGINLTEDWENFDFSGNKQFAYIPQGI